MTISVLEQEGLRLIKVESLADLPAWAPLARVCAFFHETMKPYEDSLADVESALRYALDVTPAQGFLVLAEASGEIGGALLMLRTQMAGYIPENLLLFVSVSPEMRGQGLGGKICRAAIGQCAGAVKLHVDNDNPAQRLYERLGFQSKYKEMRYYP